VVFVWERIEILLALVLGGCLFLGTQKRVFPILLCSAMLVLALFQHFGLASELAYRGRETDFPPGNASVGPIERLRALQAIYYGAELMKLIAGGVLASYLFVFRSSRRSSRKEVNAVDNPDHRHVNRWFRASHRSHGAESFGDQQHAIAQARIHGVESDHCVSAIRSVQIQRLDEQGFAAVMAVVLVGGDHVADHAADQHRGSGGIWFEAVLWARSMIE
jgi:hypothetical protein